MKQRHCAPGTAGEPEAVALDADGKKVFDLHVIVVDDRLDDEGVERCAPRAGSALWGSVPSAQ